MIFRTGLTLAALVLVACTDESGPRAEDAPDTIEVETEPVLSLGAVSGRPEIEFESLRQVVLTEDSVLAVLDAGPNEIRFFDRTGEFQGSAGGVGEGPGELQSVTGRWVDEDGRVVVHDAARGRVTTFSGDGGFVSAAAPRDPTGPETAMVEIAGRVGDRWLVLLGDLSVGSPAPGDVLQHAVTAALLGPDGGPVEGASIQLPSRCGRWSPRARSRSGPRSLTYSRLDPRRPRSPIAPRAPIQ